MPRGQIRQRDNGAVGVAISCLRWSRRLLALMILAPQVAFAKIAVDGKRARAHQCSSQRPAVRMHPHADVLYPAARVPGCLILCHLFDGLASALMPATGWRGTRIPLSIDDPRVQISQRGDGAGGVAISCLRWSRRQLALIVRARQVAPAKIAVDGKRGRAQQCSLQRPAVYMRPHVDVLYPPPGCLAVSFHATQALVGFHD